MSPIPTPTEDLVRQLRAALEPELAVFDPAQKEYCTDHTLRRYLVARRSNVEKVSPFPPIARRDPRERWARLGIYHIQSGPPRFLQLVSC